MRFFAVFRIFFGVVYIFVIFAVRFTGEQHGARRQGCPSVAVQASTAGIQDTYWRGGRVVDYGSLENC